MDNRDNLPFFWWILIVYGPIAIYRGFIALGSLKQAQAKQAFLASAGTAKYSHFENNSGIAIDPTAGTLTLRSGVTTKSYSFTDVREWTNAQATPATFIPMGGLANGLAAGAATLGAAANAAAQTGFFVKVRDVDSPEWRVSMVKKTDRDRWSEILEQEINERRRNTA